MDSLWLFAGLAMPAALLLGRGLVFNTISLLLRLGWRKYQKIAQVDWAIACSLLTIFAGSILVAKARFLPVDAIVGGIALLLLVIAGFAAAPIHAEWRMNSRPQ